LQALVYALETPGPVSSQGVARAQLLLADASSPIYSAAGTPALADAALAATKSLQDGPRF
jgi:hypothetical protein